MESRIDLRQSLDQVTLEVFSTLDALYVSRGRLQAFMSTGFLSLARARYSMGGPSSVGSLQFNYNHMEASASVDVTAEGDGGEGESSSKLCLSLVEKSAGVSKSIDQPNMDRQNHKTLGDLRQRKGHSEKAETVGMTKVTDVEEKNDNAKESQADCEGSGGDGKKNDGASDDDCKTASTDPLKLFGVLVSPHLRHSQTAFRHSLPLLIDIANLNCKLQQLQATFQDLMARKRQQVGHGENAK